MQYAAGSSASEASMKAVDFKDKFFPGIHWARQPMNMGGSVTHSVKSFGSDNESQRTESMHVDNILAGLKHEEAKQLKDL